MQETCRLLLVEHLWPTPELVPLDMKAGRVVVHGTRVALHDHDYAHLGAFFDVLGQTPGRYQADLK